MRRRSAVPGIRRVTGATMVACLVLAAFAGGSSAQDQPVPTPAATPPVAGAAAALQAGDIPVTWTRAYDDMLGLHAETFGMMRVGLVVMDDTGRQVVARRDGQPLRPASTMKVLSAAGVLSQFGPNDRITTTVHAPAPPNGCGMVDSLRLVGAGDPTLTSLPHRLHVYPSRPSTSLEQLANRVVAAGVTRVRGDIVADTSLFGPATRAPGWPRRYFDDHDARNITALTTDAGRRIDVVDGWPGTLHRITQAPDPALQAGWVLARALAQRGVRIDGVVTSTAAPTVADEVELARVRSPRVGELLQFMLEESDNHMADTLVRTAAARRWGTGTFAAAEVTVVEALAELGVDTDGVVVDDGSGLSRLDRVSPHTLASVDRAMTQAHGAQWRDWLSTASVDGTFSARLIGTSSEGRFHGKSGTLADTKAVVGHVTAPDGGRLHLAVVANDVPEDQTWRIALLADELALVATDLLDGCTRTWSPPVDPTPSPSDGPSATPATPAPTATPTPTSPLADANLWTRTCQ